MVNVRQADVVDTSEADVMMRVQYPWFGGPQVLRDAEVPVPRPGPHDVLVRVRAASLNPTDTNKRSGAIRVMYLREPRPYGMGMDVAGEVVEVGASVSTVHVGDRVLAMTKNGDGFADQTLVRERDVVVFDDTLDFPRAAAIAMSGSTAQIIFSKLSLPTGGRVLVNGAAGGIGHFLVQLLNLRGYRVTGTATGVGLDALRDLGLTEVLDYTTYDPRQLGGRFVGVIDLSGKLGAQQGRSMLSADGVFRSTVPGVGTMLGPATTALSTQSVGPVFAFANAASGRSIARMVAAGQIRALIGAARPLAEAIRTITAVESGALHVPGKVVLVA